MYTFPFTEESVRAELVGMPLVYAVWAHSNTKCVVRSALDIKDGGRGVLSGNPFTYAIDDGVLNLKKGDVPFACLNSLETYQGNVFPAGWADKKRAFVYESESIGDDYHVVISSCKAYEEKTLPRILRSLKTNGVPADKVTVVIGGCDEFDVAGGDGYQRVEVQGHMLGLTGLMPLLSGDLDFDCRYVLVLDDTCQALNGFADAIENVDCGLNQDYIRLSMFSDMGFWSMNFIRRLREVRGLDLPAEKPIARLRLALSFSSHWDVIGDAYESRERDVYGCGNKRRVIEFDFPMKKFQAKKTGEGP